jgi:copper chaperone CopZ
MMQTGKTVLVSAAMALLAITSLAGAERKAVIPVYGMDCQSCANGLAGSLKSLKGVKTAEVSLKPGQAAVTFDDSLVGLDEIRKQIEMNGFSTKPKKGGGK